MDRNRTSVETLWTTYHESRNDVTRNALVEHYSSIVLEQAARLTHRLPRHIAYDEICSAGYEGLLDAVERFDPKHEVEFSTFCRTRIVGAVMDWLRNCDLQSRTVRRFEKQRNLATEHLQVELGRPATQDEVAGSMGLTEKRFKRLARVSNAGREVTFSTLDAGNSGRDGACGNDRPWDVSADETFDPAELLEHDQIGDWIIHGLNETERLLIVMYYADNMTMADISSVLELSESRVSQIHKDVIARLRERLTREDVRPRRVA